jgi:hypothetical protein
MTKQFSSVECANCRTAINIDGDTPGYSTPCDKCGDNRRIYNASVVETVVVRDGIGFKIKRPGEKKPYIEAKSMPNYSHRLSKLVHHERVIDRDKDRYKEIVKDYESGEIIHHCEELLSQHINHGTAKPKKKRE